jgi:threonine/homoserine/homoserine lactone efflux protein
MTESMPLASLTAFLVASFILAVTPGPGVFYVVTRSIAQGTRAGLASVAGVGLGNLGNAIGASLGLAALFTISALAFTVVKYAGAAYLVWLGIQALRAAPTDLSAVKVETASPRRIFRDGFLVALLNPKTAIFFSAFLPQFMDPNASTALQSVALGAAFVGIAAVTDTIYALSASRIAPLLTRAKISRSTGRFFTAGGFIGLGIYTAISGARRPG